MDSYDFTKHKQYKFLSSKGEDSATKTFSRKDQGLCKPRTEISSWEKMGGSVRYVEKKPVSHRELKAIQRHFLLLAILIERKLKTKN